MISPKADLHFHTTASDGRLTPEECLHLAASRNLKGLAITDHDTIDGYLQIRDQVIYPDLELLAGVEISCNYEGREIHMLAYGFDADQQELRDFMAQQRHVRRKRTRQIIERLAALGFDISFDEIMAESGRATISRNHIADAMLQKSYVASRKEAFDRYLHTGGPAYVQNEYADVSDVIDRIHQCGGVCVLAHPGPYYIFEDFRYFLKAGIDGMEYIHPSHNFQTQKKIKDYAVNYGLLLTGGSDFHGIKPFEEQLVGTVCVDAVRMENILDQCQVNMDKKSDMV
ncbi:MAG: putative metal-dependent phosphoesterases (PHP family) [Bacteroidetes bacterium HLUCCA01]|nr:MAG: putative metal-dependent phosphoesterases (PHP family) [Bacteroidetes bacterium HLUCCA01]